MTFKRWLTTFLAFPIGGYLAIEVLGSLEGPGSAAAGGLVAGTVIGLGQWLALRSSGVGARWVAVTAAAVAAGSALGALLNGAGTDRADIMLAGLVTGAAVGAAQAGLLTRDRIDAATWTAVNAFGWSLGWLATSYIIVDIERGYYMFGAGGAIVVTVLTGLALRRMGVLGARVAPATA